MPGKYLRGALISFGETFPLPIPNLILFQYNPEQLTHEWTAATTLNGTPGYNGHPLAVSGEPHEKFSFTLKMDATDSIADEGPIGEALGTVSGVGTRIAALEMLLFPAPRPAGDLLGSVSAAVSGGAAAAVGGAAAAIGAALGASAASVRPVPTGVLPMVLFVWGPGRIVPVRVSALNFTETLYHRLLLVPTHAEATITLEVLTTTQFQGVEGGLGSLARGAYRYTNTLRKALAVANVGNAVTGVAGMLPI